jgi:hypothetical protein
MKIKKSFMTKKLTKQDIEKVAHERNHSVLVFENYQNVKSEITIYCRNCNTIFKTTVHSYKNAKSGCWECKKQVASKTHKNKITSDETKRKISEKAQKRPGSLKGRIASLHPRSKNGLARDLKNPSNIDYAWKNSVKKRCKYMCIVSLTKQKRKETGFVCHHLNSYDIHPDERYKIENGVYLKKEIHKKFHDF